LLPTPTVSEANGVGHAADGGMNLRHTISLLPTPRASENENRQTKRSPSQEAGTHGKCLAAEVAHLLPTPTATPYGNNQSASAGAAVRPSLDSLAPTLLPTPRATDGTKGGPNQRGSKGDLMLPSAVSQMSSGVSTSPPSAAGNASSDGPLPGQPTLWDA
jgi:DNA (cytosine-5)-methyltransferase 1